MRPKGRIAAGGPFAGAAICAVRGCSNDLSGKFWHLSVCDQIRALLQARDSFLHPLIEELCRLESGFDALCADGKVRKLKAFALFFTGDMPAVSKVFGHMGHQSLSPCRLFYKKAPLSPDDIEGACGEKEKKTEETLRNAYDCIEKHEQE